MWDDDSLQETEEPGAPWPLPWSLWLRSNLDHSRAKGKLPVRQNGASSAWPGMSELWCSRATLGAPFTAFRAGWGDLSEAFGDLLGAKGVCKML